ncbi:MAG: glycosyltransferase family 4 protein [Chthoniobacterales bacterium]
MRQSTPGLAYLFERFPSFTQTFCFREVLELRKQGVQARVFSIRKPDDEPDQDYPAELAGATRHLPSGYEEFLAQPRYRRQARRGLKLLRQTWGDESEKRRVYEALWLIPQLRAAGVQHVHVHFAGIAARTAYWLKRLGGITYSFTAHANDIFCDEPHDRLAMLISESKFVVTVSDFSLEFLRTHFPAHHAKMHRVYNGIHLERFSQSHPNPQLPLVLAVGRYIEKKGFSDLIAALEPLRDQSFECKIVGQGPLEDQLRSAIVNAGLNDKVELTGPMPESEVSALLACTSIFALPCVNASDGGKDNLPTVIMEAMAASVPVISTRVAGIPEMVIDSETGYLIPEHSPKRLTERLKELIQSPDRAASMGQYGRLLCESKFATSVTTNQLRELFQSQQVLDPRSKNWWNRLWT